MEEDPPKSAENVIYLNPTIAWNRPELEKISDVTEFENACSKQAGKVFGTSNTCENEIFCYYRKGDGFVIPLGILNKLVKNRLTTKNTYTLSFVEYPYNEGFDAFEITISEENLKKRIRYIIVSSGQPKRTSGLTQLREKTGNLATQASTATGEAARSVGRTVSTSTTAARQATASGLRRAADYVHTEPPEKGTVAVAQATPISKVQQATNIRSADQQPTILNRMGNTFQRFRRGPDAQVFPENGQHLSGVIPGGTGELGKGGRKQKTLHKRKNKKTSRRKKM
jgi:hypothetical protein